MNIKTKLSFQFTIIVAGLLILFSAFVYYFSYTSQLSRFRDDLAERAKNTAILLINVTEVDSSLLQKIHRSTFSGINEEIALTDSSYHIIYNYNLQYLSEKEIARHIYPFGTTYFAIADKDGVCYQHLYHNQVFHVYVLASDKSRRQNLADLLEILFWSTLVIIWLSILFSYFFSRKAMKPIAAIIRSVKQINPAHLNNRVDEGNKVDEIAQLAITFNDLLSRLEIAFKNQEDFVSNASHELRTPLSVMILEADLLLDQALTPEEYRKHIEELILDLKKLNLQLNSLLELAQVNQDKPLQLSVIRIDEVLFNAIREVKSRYPGRKILTQIQYPENEGELLISGNAGMLTIAFKNLVDNACKFSNDDVTVETAIAASQIKVVISDHGIGIPPAELENIFKPFSRASNVRFKSGFGIGLSLVAKILSLNNVAFTVKSSENEGTRFEMIFGNRKLPENIGKIE